MKIWLLAGKDDITTYSVERFKEAAEELNIDLTVCTPDELDLVITKEGKKSVLSTIA